MNKLDERINFLNTINTGKLELVKELLEKIDDQYLICCGFRDSCCNNNLKLVKMFLSLKRIDINEKDCHTRNGFIMACEYGHIKLVKFLLNLTGNLKINNESLNKGFEYACYSNRTKIVKLLLSRDRNDRFIKDRKINYILKVTSIKIMELFLISHYKFNINLSEDRGREINSLLKYIKTPIDFDEEMLEYKKEIQLMCVKQTLLNLCCIYSY